MKRGNKIKSTINNLDTKPQMFNRKAEKISDFLIAYKLYIRMRMRDVVVEE